MNNLSFLADKENQERMASKEFLFVAVFMGLETRNLSNVVLGKQAEELKDLIGDKDNMEVYKIFSYYIGLKTMEVQVLKEEHEYRKHVDKLYKEESDLIRILSVTNKFPNMDLYFAPDVEALRVDFAEFYSNYR